MQTTPAVTVVTIFLNEKRFLQEAIDSVRAQTVADWEYILVDDGSTDGSSDIARAAAAADPRIRYVDHPNHANQGMSASRNLGLRHARAALIAYLDADDVWGPGKLASQIAVMSANPRAAMTYGQVRLWHAWTGDSGAPRDFDYGLIDHGYHLRPNRLYEPPSLLALILRFESLTPTPSAVMIRRSVLEAVGGSEESFRSAYEDGILYVKIGASYPIYPSDACVTQYRIHQQSASRTAERVGTMANDRSRFLEWTRGYLTRQPSFDQTLEHAVRTAEWQVAHPDLLAWQHTLRAVPDRVRGALGRVVRRIIGAHAA